MTLTMTLQSSWELNLANVNVLFICCVWTAYKFIGRSQEHGEQCRDIFDSLHVWSSERDTGVRCNEVSWDTVSNKPIKACRRQPSNAMAPACNCHHHSVWWDLKGCCSGITEMQFGILSKDMKYNSRGGRGEVMQQDNLKIYPRPRRTLCQQ